MVFSSKEGYADRPVTIACGQCRGCRLRRSKEWAIRCMHEAQTHTKNCFVTLTYKDEFLPNDGGLVVSDWQLFAKRLRKHLAKRNPPERFRFYHCGEYGETHGRPHYHALLFGINFEEDREQCAITKRGDHKLYRSATLESIWTAGNSWIGEVTFESAAYVARYIMKKRTGKDAEYYYQGLKPEYTTMSRRPGIGKAWYEKYGEETYRHDSVIVRGRESPPPKYYDGLYELDKPDQFETIKSNRVKTALKHADNNTPERLKVRDEVQKRKEEIYNRSVDGKH